MTDKKKHSSGRIFLVLLIIFLLAVIGGLTYLFLTQRQQMTELVDIYRNLLFRGIVIILIDIDLIKDTAFQIDHHPPAGKQRPQKTNAFYSLQAL